MSNVMFTVDTSTSSMWLIVMHLLMVVLTVQLSPTSIRSKLVIIKQSI